MSREWSAEKMGKLAGDLRRRVIEPLELIANAEEQRRYQLSVPKVAVPAELSISGRTGTHHEKQHCCRAFGESEGEALSAFPRRVPGNR